MFNTFLAAIRTSVFYLGYVIATIVLSSLLLLSSPFLSKKSIYRACRGWCKLILFWLKLCCGVKHVISGLENLTKSPCVIISNHQSSWETLFFYQLVFPVSTILKKELLNIPFFGWALGLSNPIAIDRSKPREAGRSLLLQGINRIENGYFVIIFPEGKRYPIGELGKFSRSGAKLAIAANVPIIPIAHNAGRGWTPQRFIKTPGVVQIHIGSPVESVGRSDKELNDELREWVSQKTQNMS